MTRVVVDHAATLMSLSHDRRHAKRTDLERAMRAAAAHIVELRAERDSALARAERVRDGYARLIDQAAELVGEAARVVGGR